MSNTYLPSPNIVRERHNGATISSCQDALFGNRVIRLNGEINMTMACLITDQLRCLAYEDPAAPVIMRISSFGGGVSAGWMIYDTMRDIPCDVITICEGIAASMAAVIFTAGNTRVIMPHAELMIHDPILNSAGGSAVTVQRLAERGLEYRKGLAQVLSEHSGRSEDEILKMTSSDFYMSAEEALELGFADLIRYPEKPKGSSGNVENRIYDLEKDIEKHVDMEEEKEADFDEELPFV